MRARSAGADSVTRRGAADDERTPASSSPAPSGAGLEEAAASVTAASCALDAAATETQAGVAFPDRWISLRGMDQAPVWSGEAKRYTEGPTAHTAGPF